MKVKKSVFVFVFVMIIAAVVLTSMAAGKKSTDNEQQIASSPVFTVRTEDAEIRTLEAYLEVNANIVSGHQVAVLPEANGRLVSMRVGLGSTVQRGALIAEVDPSRPGAEYSISAVYAPVSGTVISNPQPVGSTVSTGTVLMIIAGNNSIEIEAMIPEREVGQLRTGLKAEIRLEAFPGEIFNATLTQVSPIVDPASRTKKITMRFDRRSNGLNDPRINTGMFARVKLNTRTYENVISIPQEALVEHRGKTVVYVLDSEDAPCVEMREVVVGVIIDREAEIKSGLKAGESVVVQGQQFLTDGAQVRVIGRK